MPHLHVQVKKIHERPLKREFFLIETWTQNIIFSHIPFFHSISHSHIWITILVHTHYYWFHMSHRYLTHFHPFTYTIIISFIHHHIFIHGLLHSSTCITIGFTCNIISSHIHHYILTQTLLFLLTCIIICSFIYYYASLHNTILFDVIYNHAFLFLLPYSHTQSTFFPAKKTILIHTL